MKMESIAKQQLHVVAVPLAAQGHLNPLMRFCKLLAAQGVLVTFVNIDPVHHRLEELNLQAQQDIAAAAKQATCEDAAAAAAATASGIQKKIRRAHIPIQGLDLANDFRISMKLLFEAQNSIASPLEGLILELNLQGPPVTCLVSDMSVTMSTQHVADKLNIPRVVLYPSSASVFLLTHYVMQGDHISLQEVLASLSRRAVSREVVCEGLPGLPTIYNNEVPRLTHMVDDCVHMWELGIRLFEESFRHAHSIVFNSFSAIEEPALTALANQSSLPIYGVGPLIEPLDKESSTSLWKENETCIPWLDQQPPLSVLYISFGSITLLTQTQFEEILAGLVASKQRFLWVFRPDLVENMSHPVFAPDILSRSHGKGYVVDWAPQLRVLSHPSVGGFLTHCGWNSTIEAISCGMPMLCWPYFADQFLDAKYVVEEWKVGLHFEANKDGSGLVESCEVERVIKALMEGKEGETLRKNAMRLKEASYSSLLPGGTSHNSIEALLKSLM